MISAPDRANAVQLILEAMHHGAGCAAACEALGITERTYFRWQKLQKEHGNISDLRPTAKRSVPANKLSENERQKIIDTVTQEDYKDMPPCEIVPALADKGQYLASESTFYRVLRQKGMAGRRGRAAAPVKRKISTHYATGPNQVWMWDITYLNGPVKGTFYYLYLISDLYSRDIVGWEVWQEESAEHASELIQRATLQQKRLTTSPLVLHSDNGSPMKGATMLTTLYALGITPSNSRPRVSNDNAYAESLFRTLKYRPNYQPKGFERLEDARAWCQRFVEWYRCKHHHSGIKFLTPAQRHNGEGETILTKRHEVYLAAKQAHPERWNGRKTRDWILEDIVFLNPDKTVLEEDYAAHFEHTVESGA